MDAINFGTECWFCAVLRVRALGPGGPGERPVRRRQRLLDPANTGNAQRVRHGDAEEQRHHHVRDQGRQRAVGRPDHRVQRAAAEHRRLHARCTRRAPIILGTGGDNSNGSDGSFFEGVMTAGYPSDATDNAVQANIVAAGYSQAAAASRSSGTAVHASPTSTAARSSTAGQLRHRQRHRDRRCGRAGQHLPAVDVHQRRQRPLHHHQRQQRHGPGLGELRHLRRHR